MRRRWMAAAACAAGAHAHLERSDDGTRYQTAAAAFGPGAPPAGVAGVLVPVELFASHRPWGCDPVQREEMARSIVARSVLGGGDAPRPWIALVERGRCSFAQKARAMQASGAAAVVVGNTDDGLFRMASAGDASDVRVPAAMVMQGAYQELRFAATAAIFQRIRDAAESGDGPASTYGLPVYADGLGRAGRFLLVRQEDAQLSVRLMPDGVLDTAFVAGLGTLVAGLVLFALVMAAVWRCAEALEDGAESSPETRPRDLPARPEDVAALARGRWRPGHRGSASQDTCAVCIEAFADGHEVRRLACRHLFHAACIDPWLLRRKRMCPICKSDACGDRGDAAAVCSYPRTPAELQDEHARLLPVLEEMSDDGGATWAHDSPRSGTSSADTFHDAHSLSSMGASERLLDETLVPSPADEPAVPADAVSAVP